MPFRGATDTAPFIGAGRAQLGLTYSNGGQCRQRCPSIKQADLFVVLVVVEVVKGPAVNQAFQNYVLINPVVQYTFVSSIALLYYNISEVIFARTIGKLLTKTVVVDAFGMPPSHQMIMVRSICRLIPFNSFSFIGIIPRGWHDSLSKTYVVSITLLEEKRREVQSSKNNTSEE